MKFRETCFPLILALLLACCGKKEAAGPVREQVSEVAAPLEGMPVPAAVPAVVEEEKPRSGERVAKLGFARHLPADTEVLMSFYEPAAGLKRVQSGGFWKFLREEAGFPDAGDAGGDDVSGPAALFGQEFTIALGRSGGEQTAHLLALNHRYSRHQARGMVRALARMVRAGGEGSLEDALDENEIDLATEWLSDPEAGVELLGRLRMPPLYLAFRTTPENREAAAGQLAQLAGFAEMLGPVVEPLEVERGGNAFTGVRISGEKVAESLQAEREGLLEMLDEAVVDRLFAAVAQRDLVLLSGMLGDHAVLFIGASADDFTIAPSPELSLAASGSLAFCDAYLDKDLAAVIHGAEEPLRRMAEAAGGISSMVDGLRDGLAEEEAFGDTRDLEVLLTMVAEREAALLGMGRTEAAGTVVFFEDGLKVESHGGNDSGAVDWDAANRLGGLGDGENVVLFANMTGAAAYDEKARAWFEVLVEAAHAMAVKMAELPLENDELARFKEIAGFLDTRPGMEFITDVTSMWDALSGDFSAGLGAEGAWVVDLNGTVPALPGLPQEVVDEAAFPRVTLVAPVRDRAKLALAWEGMNRSATGMLARLGEMNGQHIPMQKPISSEKNGYTTWFFPMPFFNDDFVPSVTVGDEWFAASTSKVQTLDLLAKAGGGEPRDGLWLAVDFRSLHGFIRESLAMIDEHPDVFTLDDEDRRVIRGLDAALADLDSLTVHSRREDGVLRGSMHFKTR